MTAALLPALGVVFSLVVLRYTWRGAQRSAARARVVDSLSQGGRPKPRVQLRARWQQPPLWLATQVDELEAPFRADAAWRWWRGLLVTALLIGLFVGGVVLAVLGAALVAGAPIAAATLLRSRQAATYDSNLADALDAMARGARSGASLTAALAEAPAAVRGPVATDLHRVVASIDRGQQLANALSEWVARRPRTSVRLTVGALVLAAESGGAPARVIEEVAGAVRARLQVEGEARALAAQARLSALVVGLAPIAFLALTSVTDARSAHTLFGTPVGVACLAAGLTLDAIGAAWMHRISESVAG